MEIRDEGVQKILPRISEVEASGISAYNKETTPSNNQEVEIIRETVEIPPRRNIQACTMIIAWA